MNTTKYTQTQYEIFKELYKALEKLGAKSDLLSCIGSLGDTLPDEDILKMLQEWNNS